MQQQKKEQVKNIEDVRTQKVKWIHHRRAIPRRGWQVKNKKKPSALSMWGFFLHLVNYILKKKKLKNFTLSSFSEPLWAINQVTTHFGTKAFRFYDELCAQ